MDAVYSTTTPIPHRASLHDAVIVDTISTTTCYQHETRGSFLRLGLVRLPEGQGSIIFSRIPSIVEQKLHALVRHPLALVRLDGSSVPLTCSSMYLYNVRRPCCSLEAAEPVSHDVWSTKPLPRVQTVYGLRFAA